MLFKKSQTHDAASNLLDDALQAMAKGQLFAVSLNENREFTQNDGSGEAMADYLEKNADEAASKQPRTLFSLKVPGCSCHVYPFFTSSERAREWIQKKPFPWSGFTAVTVLGVQTPQLFRNFTDAPPAIIVVIDPMSDDERVLTHREMQTLAKL